MMKIEDRLRAELDRSGRSTKVGVAPSVDELSAVASQRRQRNRVVGGASALAVTGAVLLGAFISSSPDDGTLVVADGGDAIDAPGSDLADAPEAAETAATDDSLTTATTTANAGESVTAQDAEEGDVASPSANDSASAETPLQSADQSLQGDSDPMTVATRESAIEFAGGSGVLLVPHEGGYRGLATRFASDGAQAIGITSLNGLDWAEVPLTGVPTGATATVLRQYNGTFVALFDHFDAAVGQKRMYVGVSTDLGDWDLSDPLPGRDVVATDLAVGAPGVIIIGDDFAPNVWIGPIGGPYELTGQVDAASLAGVTTLDGQFLVAGRSPQLGITLFSTTDGAAWSARQLSSADAIGANQTISVGEGTVVLTNITDEGQVTLLSSDGGLTWEQLSTQDVRSLSVSRSALGFIGGSGLDATVTLADADSIATADLDVAAPDRLSLLATTADQAVMLVSNADGGLTWIVASR